MKIMQIAPFALPIKKQFGYGGIERVVRDLDIEFSRQGHDSFVVGTHDSEVQGTLCPVNMESSFISFKDEKGERGYKRNNDSLSQKLETFSSKAFEYIDRYNPDVVHDHLGIIKSEKFKKRKYLPPILFTLHASVNKKDKQKLGDLKDLEGKRVFFNSISNSQYKYFNEIVPVDYMVYNAIDINDYPYGPNSNNFVFSIGLIDPKKGPDIALEVAKRLNKKIVVAGPVHHFNENIKIFWDNKIKSNIDLFSSRSMNAQEIDDFLRFFLDSNHNSAYIGEVDDFQKKEWFKRAEAFYFPIRWQEPFGLVMIESMACGTPVVAYSGGAVPEIIKHRETGYVVPQGDFQNFVHYASKVNEISGTDCREHVQNNFNIPRQAKDYIGVYQDMISKASPKMLV